MIWTVARNGSAHGRTAPGTGRDGRDAKSSYDRPDSSTANR